MDRWHDSSYFSYPGKEIPSFMIPPDPNREQERGMFPLVFAVCTFCSASLCMQPDIWTPPWAKGMSPASKKANQIQRHTRTISPLTVPSPSIWPEPYFDLLCFISTSQCWLVGVGKRKTWQSLAQSQTFLNV